MALKQAKMQNHPHTLTEKDCERIEAVLSDELDYRWISDAEIEAYQDLLYDHIVSKRQTHPGSLILQ